MGGIIKEKMWVDKEKVLNDCKISALGNWRMMAPLIEILTVGGAGGCGSGAVGKRRAQNMPSLKCRCNIQLEILNRQLDI